MATMITLSGSLKEVVDKTIWHLDRNYKIATEWSRVDWPFFWRRRYFVNVYQRPIQGNTLGIYIGGQRIATLNPMQFIPEEYGRSPLRNVYTRTLQEQLDHAIQTEDYELAARIRDLINKQ